MQLRTLSFLVLFFSLSGSVFAACERFEDVPTYRLDMFLGRVVVDPNLPINSIITEKTWTMPDGDKSWAMCDGGTRLDAILAPSRPVRPDNIHETNVPGIGLKFDRGGNVNISYPGHFTVDGTGPKPVHLAKSTFRVQVIKIAETTGSGTITDGEYTHYGYFGAPYGTPALTTYLSANAITIISPSCKVTSGINQNVFLKSVTKGDFSGVGSTTGDTPFSINMLCSGGTGIVDKTNIYLSFNGELAPDTQSQQGVLKNIAAQSSAAEGVGIQIVDNNDIPLEWLKRYKVAEVMTNNEKAISLNYIAKYYQFKTNISSGEVQGKMIFNIFYD